MDLIRDVSIFAEGQDEHWFAAQIEIEGWDQKAIVYHVGLAIDAGFLDGKDESSLSGREFYVLGLTYYGHEFLHQIRSDNVWTKLRALAKEQGIDLTVDLVKRLAPKVAFPKRTSKVSMRS